MKIEENTPLAQYTTFRLGGPAKHFVRVTTVDELREVFQIFKSSNLQILLLGGGSNLLVSDTGFDGLAIKIELKGIERSGDTLVANAGESWDGLVEYAITQNLWGIENLSGIPGTVGAAPVQNIGAYGVELKDTLLWVEALDIKTGEVVRFLNAECEFGYRSSRFKQGKGRYVIVRVALGLTTNGTPNATYKDLADISRFDLDEVRQRVLDVRSKKFPDLSQEGTAGSFFLNPVVPHDIADELSRTYPAMPQFKTSGGIKLSLAWLLDNALTLHGFSVGGARLFERQPLVIVANKSARAEDVKKLSAFVKKEVEEKLHIKIEEEVRVI